MKRCTKCGEEKDERGFSKNTANRNGLHSWCKECASVYHKSYRVIHQDKLNSRSRTWRLLHQKELQAYVATEQRKIRHKANYLAHRAKRLEYAGVYRVQHKEDIIAYNKKRYTEQAEVCRAATAAYKKTSYGKANSAFLCNRRRMRIKEQTSGNTIRFRQWIRSLSPFACIYCGIMIDGTICNIDHIIPLAKGGHEENDNLLPICFICNCRKRTLTHEEFLAII